MRLTLNNIDFVKEFTYNGVTYLWDVAMKSHRICDGREFINYDKNGRTVVKEYKFERLPKTVQKFIQTSNSEVWTEDDEVTIYIYK